jgi:leucyl aminopeptidase
VPFSVLLEQSVPENAALGVFVSAELDASSNFDVEQLAEEGFEARSGEVSFIHAGGRSGLAVGLGRRSEISTKNLRHAVGALIRGAGRFSSIAIQIPSWLPESLHRDEAVEVITEGLILGAYEYLAFKSVPSRRRLQRAYIVSTRDNEVILAIDRGRAVAAATCFARDLVNEPGGSLTPQRFGEIAAEQGVLGGFGATVWTEPTIRDQRLGGVLGVSRGSSLPPRFVELSYDPGVEEGETELVALCGKGVTFDSGGLSLKTTEGMISMKGDMAGAAVVLAAFSAMAVLRPKVRVRGFIPLTDNMVGPDATRVGDVLTIRNGKTVEVLNTDAEGRLILADALSLASERQPTAIIDLATLTGACMTALGEKIAGVMGNNIELVDRVRKAAETAGEPVWHLPLPEELRKKLDSDVADLRNVADNRFGGALVAGLFLSEFVGEGIPWVHLDIAGPAYARDDDGEVTKGGTGFGVRLLLQLLVDWNPSKK